MKKINILLISIFITLNGSDLYYYQGGKKVFLSPVTKTTSIIRSTNSSTENTNINFNYFKTSNNIVLGVNNQIIIKTTKIDEVLEKYNLQLKKKLFSNVYLIELEDKDLTLDIANLLYQDSDISYAHPNFTKQINKR